MNIPNRAAWWIVGLGILAAAAAYLYWTPVLPFGDQESRSQEDDQYQQEVRRGQKLKAQLRELPRIREAKRRIANDLIAGRLTLAEAAARVRELDRQTMDAPTYSRVLKLHFPGASEEERICRKVIRHALNVVDPQSEAAAGLKERLETELRKHLAEYQSLAQKEG
jgi:hypothetical protein